MQTEGDFPLVFAARDPQGLSHPTQTALAVHALTPSCSTLGSRPERPCRTEAEAARPRTASDSRAGRPGHARAPPMRA
eukprot:scaffold131723_cov48-Phaeocystis_antarctica.AAC.1